ncbi:hypothetical protein BBP40_007624 [Aspergillus hancockii]|nr:hypothetical protein BBP40_007624 [Aspergillus hancockii]
MERMEDSTVLKAPFPGPEMENNTLGIAKEASIYYKLGLHQRLVRLFGHSRDGLVLEYMENGDHKTYLHANDSSPMNLNLKQKWVYQVTKAVNLLHKNGIIHCDIKPRTFLLDATLDTKIIDFFGFLPNGSKSGSVEGIRLSPTSLARPADSD